MLVKFAKKTLPTPYLVSHQGLKDATLANTKLDRSSVTVDVAPS